MLKESNPGVSLDHVELQAYEEALASPEAAEWKLAMNKELASLQANGLNLLSEGPCSR